MKRFKAIPGREIITSTRAIKASYTPRYSRESEIEDYEIDELLEIFGDALLKNGL